MILSVVLTLEEKLSGNAFMTAILSSQIVLNIVNATIVGGVYELTSWLPAVYLQVLTLHAMQALSYQTTVKATLSFPSHICSKKSSQHSAEAIQLLATNQS